MLRGDKVIEQLNRDFEGVHLPRDVEKTIIRNACAAERERCARLVEDQAEFVAGDACEKLCNSLAALIRSAPAPSGTQEK